MSSVCRVTLSMYLYKLFTVYTYTVLWRFCFILWTLWSFVLFQLWCPGAAIFMVGKFQQWSTVLHVELSNVSWLSWYKYLLYTFSAFYSGSNRLCASTNLKWRSRALFFSQSNHCKLQIYTSTWLPLWLVYCTRSNGAVVAYLYHRISHHWSV